MHRPLTRSAHARDPAATGHIVLLLQAHLPYVRDPEEENGLAEDWFFEAVTETYIPLLSITEGWLRDGLPHFVHERARRIDEVWTKTGRAPVIVAPYDAELFGHWWFEGPEFLDLAARKSCTQSAYRPLDPVRRP